MQVTVSMPWFLFEANSGVPDSAGLVRASALIGRALGRPSRSG